MAELVLAVGLLATLAVVVIGLFVRLNIATTKTADKSVALELAGRILEEAAHAAPDAWNLDSSIEATSHEPDQPVTYYYRVDKHLLSAESNPMGDLYRLDVEVSWWPQDPSHPHRSRRADYGKLHLRLSRSVYIEALRL